MAKQDKDQSPVYIFVASFALIVAGALLYLWSDYTENGAAGAKAEVWSAVMVGLGAIGLIVNYVRK